MKDVKVKEHFDEIAENYYEQIAGHIRDHLIDKWWQLVSCYFPKDAYLLDIGCGDGTNVRFLKEKAINAIGIDASTKLIKSGKYRYPELEDSISEGDAFSLDFEDETFDVAFMIGLLHHIYSKDDQKRAIEEALRVVKKKGCVIIRESNLRNPIFRLFWNYVFPMTSKIDKFGGENWVPSSFFEKANFCVEKILYFTFLPSFTPSWLMPVAKKMESFLEKSIFKSLSAHYVAILKKWSEPHTM